MSTDNIRYQERCSPEDDISNRGLLSRALESEAENEEEKNLLIEYKNYLRHLEISHNYFYEEALRDLESQQPIKNIIAREREKANKKQKEKDAQLLAEYKAREMAKIEALLEENERKRKEAVEARDRRLAQEAEEKQALLDKAFENQSGTYYSGMNVDRYIKNTMGKPINIKLKPSAATFASKPQPPKDEPNNTPIAPLIGIGFLVILLFIIVIGFLSA